MNNSLIETLAEQTTSAVESRPGTGACEMSKYNLKFAALLVAECIDAVKNTGTKGAVTTYEVDIIQATITEAVKSIEKRFSRTI